MTDERIAVEVAGEACTVKCTGRVAGEHASQIRRQIKPLVGPGRRITLDLTGVTYMDSMGLGVIAALYVSARGAGCQLDVVNLSPRIRELFSVSRLLTLFEPAGESNLRMP